MMNEPISSIMTVNVQTVTEDQTLSEVLGLLKSKKISNQLTKTILSKGNN